MLGVYVVSLVVALVALASAWYGSWPIHIRKRLLFVVGAAWTYHLVVLHVVLTGGEG